jgi:serine/threonine protein kinase
MRNVWQLQEAKNRFSLVVDNALSQGAMGEVYRATDTKLGREEAIKVLPPEIDTSDGVLLVVDLTPLKWREHDCGNLALNPETLVIPNLDGRR